MSRRPALSVVVASYNAEKTIERCLHSLRSQKTGDDFEIIVVDSSADGTATLVAAEFPEVRLLSFADRKFCGEARNTGISVARGDIIALTDADCTVSETWVEDILRAHRSGELAIGGAVANAEPSNLVGWAAYFCEFSHWMPTSKSRWLDDVAGANMSYKKEAFQEYGSFLEGTYCSDSEFHWRLGRDGQRLLFLPDIVVSHHSISGFRELIQHEFEHGRCFARVRMLSEGFSGLRRLAYVALAPLIPLKILLNVSSNNLIDRVYLTHFLKALPVVGVGLVSWSMGEAVGYAKDWRG